MTVKVGKLHLYDNTQYNRGCLYVISLRSDGTPYGYYDEYPAEAIRELDVTMPFVVVKQLFEVSYAGRFLILTADGCVATLSLPDPENIKVWNGNDQF